MGSLRFARTLILLPVSLILLLKSRTTLVQQEEEVDFPPLLDADDIAYFFERNDLDGLHWALTNVFERSDRNHDSAKIQHPLPEQLVSRGGGSTYTTAYKLKMDLEQAQYLVTQLRRDRDQEMAAFLETHVVPLYQKVLDRIPPLDQLQRTRGLYPFQPHDKQLGIEAIYNKALYAPQFGQLKDPNTGQVLPVLNPNLDLDRIQRQWMGEEQDSTPGIVVVDDILNPAALSRIRQLLLEKTVWYQTKMPLQFGGYAGAYIDDGLNDRILLQLSMELYQALPRIMAGHFLRYLWAYRYDAEYTGINLHADEAAVNVNLWLTPDDANLDPTSGGLVVFTAKPPPDWEFTKYNTDTDFVRDELLKPTQFANVTIPHKQNRAVLFDSALFHQTDQYKFRKGYENCRINLTLLYGTMQRGSSKKKNQPQSHGSEL